MPISMKLECAHCGSALKTAKMMPPGAKVRCPRCKGVFHVSASDDAGLIETIPVEGETETIELDSPSTEAIAAAFGNGAKGAKRGKEGPVVSGPQRAAGPSLAATKKLEVGGKSPFTGTRTVVAGIGATVIVACGGAFAWWYVGTVKELDVAGEVAVERRTEMISKAAAPLTAPKPSAKSPGLSGGAIAAPKPPPPRGTCRTRSRSARWSSAS